MVKVEIYKDGMVGWYRNDCDFFYYMKYPNGDCICANDEGYIIENCITKTQYYRLLSLKVLW